MWEIISWIFTGVAALGARETSQEFPNMLKTNLLYCIANIYNVIYFVSTGQIPFIFVNALFLYFSIRGICKQFKQLKLKEGPNDDRDSSKQNRQIPGETRGR